LPNLGLMRSLVTSAFPVVMRLPVRLFEGISRPHQSFLQQKSHLSKLAVFYFTSDYSATPRIEAAILFS